VLYIWIVLNYCASKDLSLLRSRKTHFVAGFVFEKDAGMLQRRRGFQLEMNGITALPINTAIEIVPTTIPNAEESIRSSF
jgi:hypothetical protein